MTRPAPIIAGILAALLLLFGAYMGGYYALLDGRDEVLTFDYRWEYEPLYVWRDYGDGERIFFTLAHQIDRQVRPAYWSGEGAAKGRIELESGFVE